MKNNHFRGQPSIAEQMEITLALRPLYLKTYSIERASGLIGRDRNTVARRFKPWENEDMARLNAAFDKGDNIHKAEYLRLNQMLLEDAQDDLEEIKNDIKIARQNDDPMLPQLFATRDKIRRSLDILGEKRCAVKISPGAERVVDKVIEARIQNHVKSISAN